MQLVIHTSNKTKKSATQAADNKNTLSMLCQLYLKKNKCGRAMRGEQCAASNVTARER